MGDVKFVNNSEDGVYFKTDVVKSETTPEISDGSVNFDIPRMICL